MFFTTCLMSIVLATIGCFAFGSSEITSERAEKKRVQKLYRKKYGRTY